MEIHHPKFNTREEWIKWRQEWRQSYKKMSSEIRDMKYKVKDLMKNKKYAGNEQKKLVYMRRAAHKMNTALKKAKEEASKLKKSLEELQEQLSSYPLSIVGAKEVIFHFNTMHLRNPNVPMWVVKAKGKTYYVRHVDAHLPWSTKETPDSRHTKGSIKFKNASVTINEEAVATIVAN